MTTATRPAYRQPWTNGAKAYPEADSFEAILNVGCKRKRNRFIVLMYPADGGLDGVACVCCGGALTEPWPGSSTGEPDRYCFVDVSPSKKTCAPKHYYCAWGSLMTKVFALRDLIGG